MPGATNSTLLITAGLAMITAASFLLKAEREKKEREQEAKVLFRRLQRQSSRSKRDRAIVVPQEEECPEGVDTSFETLASSEASLCADPGAEPEESSIEQTEEWKGMVTFVMIAVVWGTCVVFLPVVLGIKHLEDVVHQDWMKWIPQIVPIQQVEPVVIEPHKWWQIGRAL